MSDAFTDRVNAVAAALYEHFSQVHFGQLDLQLIKERAAQIVIGVDALTALDREHGSSPRPPLTENERAELGKRLREWCSGVSLETRDRGDLAEIIADLEIGK
jgi:hypothetical protein